MPTRTPSPGLPLPRTNVLVDGYLVDCFWPEANLVVELDGFAFHHSRRAFEHDRRKIADLRLAGREVLPLTHRQLAREPGWTIATVAGLSRRAPARQRRKPS